MNWSRRDKEEQHCRVNRAKDRSEPREQWTSLARTRLKTAGDIIQASAGQTQRLRLYSSLRMSRKHLETLGFY